MSDEPRWVPKVHPLSRPMAEEDPLELHGVLVDGDPVEMVRCVMEEFAAMGWQRPQLLRLFRDPEYPGLVQVARSLGWSTIEAIADDVTRRYGAFRIRVHYVAPPEEESPSEAAGPEVVPLRNPFDKR